MSLSNFIHGPDPSTPTMPPLPQFVGQDLPVQHEEFRHPIFPQSACERGLIGGTLVSLITKSPIPMLMGLSQCVSKVFAQQKVGNEFQVNTYTGGQQRGPSVASLANGSFVVTWYSCCEEGPGNYGVYGQLFNGNGTKIWSEFRANTYTTDNQISPSVASLSNGNFVVTWQSQYQEAGSSKSYGVYGQLFDENATKIGNEFHVNTYTDDSQERTSVASFTNDNFVVTWHSYDQDRSSYGVYGQLFSGNRSKIGQEFRINTYTTNYQFYPSVASFSNGNFVVTWTSGGEDGSGSGVYGQLFNGNGNQIGIEFRANFHTVDDQRYSSVASLNDNFVVVWESVDQDGSGNGVFGQLFSGDGSKIGSELRANTRTSGDQMSPSVAGFSNGNFVVTWEGRDGDGFGVYGQLFDKNGAKIGSEFRANSYTTNDQLEPSVTSLIESNFVVTWQSYLQDGSGYGIYGQIFHDNITNPSSSTTTSSSTTSTISSTETTTSTTSSFSSSTTSKTTTISSTTSNFSSNAMSVISRTSTSGNPSRIPITTDATSNPVQSTPQKRLGWLWTLLGIAGSTCVGIFCYVFFKRSAQRKTQDAEQALETITPEGGLSSKREGKTHTRIGDRYDLVNWISRPEAEILFDQTGISIAFPEGKNKTEAVIGEGSFGKVRLAYDVVAKRFVGVKKIKGAAQIAQSKQEGELHTKLRGKPNILPILNYVGSTDSQGFPVIYEFITLAGFGSGEKLREHLRVFSDASKKEQIVIHVAKGLLTGLFHMHQERIFHLDLKLSNTVFDINGGPFIIDFGCAKELPDGQIREQLAGDTEYFSPERISFFKQISMGQQPDPIAAESIDAWALGVSLLELVTGEYPFDRNGFGDKIRHWDNAYFQEKLDAIPLLNNPEIGSFLWMVKRLLEVDPQKRMGIAEAHELLAHFTPFSSPRDQQEAFADLQRQKPPFAKSSDSTVAREQNEQYADVFLRRYGFTPDDVHPRYQMTPDHVHPSTSSQASATPFE